MIDSCCGSFANALQKEMVTSGKGQEEGSGGMTLVGKRNRGGQVGTRLVPVSSAQYREISLKEHSMQRKNTD